MRVRKFFTYIVSVALIISLLAGCGGARLPGYNAGLLPLGADADAAWSLPDRTVSEGEGNIIRTVSGAGLNASQALELATGHSGRVVYTAESDGGSEVILNVRLQFLSTQGTGKLYITALDSSNRPLGTVGWVVTGGLPVNAADSKWHDRRLNVNYKGEWLTAVYHPAELLSPFLTNKGKVAKYRASVEVGQGQHALISDFKFAVSPVKSVAVIPLQRQLSANKGDHVTIEADVINQGTRTLTNISLALSEPYGLGIALTGSKEHTVETLAPGEKKRLSWNVQAARPDAVNFNKPWKVGFAVSGESAAATVEVSVADNRPGKIYYVMTEDLEAIDSAGYGAAWGNRNGWLEPKELFVQMVTKAERLNAIADAYGAKWTHYIAWPLVKAAEWAGTQSPSGKWKETVAAIRHSAIRQNESGHEYALHLHIDYDPYLPGNVLSYNHQVDGIWANHLRHGWSHSIATEGDFSDRTSRAGSLYTYQRIIDELAVNSPHGQILDARVGSFDFGAGPESEGRSTRVYRKVGLWGTSDADGNEGGITAGSYGDEIYFSKPDDINTAAADLTSIGLVEFRPTPRQFINYDSQSADTMNKLAEQGVTFFTSDGAVKPGIHGIVGFTHAMFIMGEGDWQSVEGGHFAAIDQHLAYLKEKFVNRGLVAFATANELVRAYLDYYTPKPVAVYGRRLNTTMLGVSEYAIDILGKDIPIDSAHVHTVDVKYPLYLRDSAYRVAILKNGLPIYTTWGLPTPFNDIRFTVDDKHAKYTLKVYHNDTIAKLIDFTKQVKSKFLKNF